MMFLAGRSPVRWTRRSAAGPPGWPGSLRCPSGPLPCAPGWHRGAVQKVLGPKKSRCRSQDRGDSVENSHQIGCNLDVTKGLRQEKPYPRNRYLSRTATLTMPSNAVTAPDGPEWITISECARRVGEHRQQISRMVWTTGTFPHTHLDRTGTRIKILWTAGLAQKIANSKRIRLPG